MSHVTTIEMEEKYDVKALKQMCKDMGWEWREGQRTFNWYGTHVGDYPIPQGFTKADMGRCEHAIHIPGASYELGYSKGKLLWDFYSPGGLQRVLGKEAGFLKQGYAMAKTKVTAKAHQKRFYSRPVTNPKLKGWQMLRVEV